MADKGIIRSFGDFQAEVTVSEQHADDITITSHPVERGANITDHMFKMPSQLTVELGWSANAAAVLSGDVPITVQSAANSQSPTNQFQALTKAFNTFKPIVAAVGGSQAVGVLHDSYQALSLSSSLSGGTSGQNIDALYNAVSPTVAAYGGSSAVSLLNTAYTATKKQTVTTQKPVQSFVGQKAIIQLYQQLIDLQKSGNLIEVQTGKRLYTDMLIKSLRVTTDQKTENVLLITATLQEIFLVDTVALKMPPNGNMAAPQVTGAITMTGTKALQ